MNMRARNLGVGDFNIGCADPQNDTPTIERCTDCGCAFDSDELVAGLCVECEPTPKFHHIVTPEEDADLEEWIGVEQDYAADYKETERIYQDKLAAHEAALSCGQ